jgi:hypothetical protein
VTDEPYDLWIADEGWDVDYFLFDNPELKRTAYAWLTDFVGWLPMPEGGAAEAALTADWNAERVERMRRYPRLRDRSVFVGNPGDLVDDPLGPGLPSVRDWALERYTCAGYVTGSALPDDREALRAELGYRPGERICRPSTPSTSPKPSSPRSTARPTTARWRQMARPGGRPCWRSCCSRQPRARPREGYPVASCAMAALSSLRDPMPSLRYTLRR